MVTFKRQDVILRDVNNIATTKNGESFKSARNLKTYRNLESIYLISDVKFRGIYGLQDNSKDYVCAAITRLIDKAALRVGHEVNDAVGASTLKTRHITLTGNSLQLDYKAKGGKRVRKQIKDKTLARVLHNIDDLQGRRVFQYIGQSGQLHPIDSSNVNDYIGEDFSAKTFRTWHGTLAAFETAQDTEGEPTLKAMSEAAAKRLHNTPAICRSSYIHPRVIALANKNIAAKVKACDTRGLRKSERQLLEFIRP